MAKTITWVEYLQLTGLLTLAHQHNSQLNDIRDAALRITGETSQDGHTADAVYGEIGVGRLLENLDIEVEALPKRSTTPEQAEEMMRNARTIAERFAVLGSLSQSSSDIGTGGQ